MLRHARKWLLIALIAATFGFTGLLRSTAMIAQAVFYAAAGFTLLSVLFWLFEDGRPVSVPEDQPQSKVIPLTALAPPAPPQARAA